MASGHTDSSQVEAACRDMELKYTGRTTHNEGRNLDVLGSMSAGYFAGKPKRLFRFDCKRNVCFF